MLSYSRHRKTPKIGLKTPKNDPNEKSTSHIYIYFLVVKVVEEYLCNISLENIKTMSIKR